ncbi:MAG: terpene cyclase/mutase family protein, partial [Planctomycetes bacterium]|nr:terpene cyclase/mutase family protein [Planctomycetota bacterium]
MVRGSLPALLLIFFIALGARAAARPAQDAPRGPSSEAVNAAIERGVAFLLRSQNRDGSFGVDLNERGLVWHDLRDGATALTVYTLLKCGFAPDHPALQRASTFLLESEPRHTYATGVLLHAIGALGDARNRKRMQKLVETLLGLRESGGWDYPGLNRADLSNTQVAALGLRAAHAAGLELPKSIWSELVGLTLRYQEKPLEIPGAGELPKERRRMAGFAYEPGGRATASMTTAGLTILGIVGEDPARVDHRFAADMAEARELALNWLAQHYSVAGNPEGEAVWHYYYLYGLERVGALFGLTEIAGHDWYAEGAAELLREQREHGGWSSDGRVRWPPAPMPIANTCFALLFLRKATLSTPAGRREHVGRMEEPGSDVWVRVESKQTWTLWVSGFSPAARARFLPANAVPADAGKEPEPALFVERVEWWIDGVRVES